MVEFDPGPSEDVAEGDAGQRVQGRSYGTNAAPNYGNKFSESDYAPIRLGEHPFGVPSWLGDDSRGRQSRPKRRNSVERDPADLLHALIRRTPAG